MSTTKRQVMVGRFASRVAVATALVAWLVAVQPSVLAQGGAGSQHWVGTWATAMVARPPDADPPRGQTELLNVSDQTLRQIIHTSIGGERVRVLLSNVFGTEPLAIGAATVAHRDTEAAIAEASVRALTFSGKPTTSIPPGAVILSDPVDLEVAALADLVVDMYLPGDTSMAPLTLHNGANQTNYVSSSGNHAGVADLPVMTTMPSWLFLARVEVLAPREVGAVVTLGDSITDGTRSTPDTNNRWPDHLARRFAAENIRMGVLNLGIAGNRVLSEGNGVNALARFDRDVLAQPGVTHVVVLEGINDIRRATPPPMAEDIIAGHLQLIRRAHAQGLTIYGATLTPFEASVWTPENEAKRQAVNAWIRDSGMYDDVIEFDEATLDPSHPTQLLPNYDSSDNIHPSDEGYEAMASAIDLTLFKAPMAQSALASR
jgi:lysophospholipase L1-like esterase